MIGNPTLPLVGVLPHRAVPGMDRPGDRAPLLATMSFQDAFEGEHRTDAHLVCYRPTHQGRPAETWARLNKGILPLLREAGGEVVVHSLCLDWDCPDHQAWTPEFEKEFDKLMGEARDAGFDLVDQWTLFYNTRSGCRFVYALTEPVTPERAEDLLRGMIAAFADHHIELDRITAWNSLFRLPKVRRDGADTAAAWSFRLETRYGNRLDPAAIHPVQAPKPLPPSDSGVDDPTLPGSDDNARGRDHMRETLRRKEWTYVGTHDGNERWRRPGKTKGHSATFDGSHFFCFSSNAEPFTAGEACRPFRVYSLLEHDGDDSKAAGTLAQLGYGATPEDQGVDLSNFNVTPDPWPEPRPLCGDLSEPTPFPLDALPDWLAAMVKDLAYTSQTPPELAGCIGLASLSLACAGKWVVNPWGGWVEQLCLWFVVSLPPGCRKTAVFSAMAAPLVTWEKDRSKALEPVIAAANTKQRILTGKLEAAEKKASKSGGNEQALFEAVNLGQELEALKIPVAPRLFANDTTPEGLTRLLAEQGGRIGLFSAEGGEFTAIAGGRYAKDGKSNVEIYLKGHSGDAIRVDRAARDRNPIIVDHPTLVMALCVQPAVLLEAWANDQFTNRGLLARFFFSLPANPLGSRKVRTKAVPTKIVAAYEHSINRMVNADPGGDPGSPPQLVFSSEAADLMEEYATRLEPELGPGGKVEHLSGWAGKLAGGIARLAGLLHLASSPGDGSLVDFPIQPDVLGAAIQLGDYFLNEATRAYGAYGSDPRIFRAAKILNWIKKNNLARFTDREAQRGCKLKVDETKAPLEILRQAGYIRPARGDRTRPKGQPGRDPSNRWEVNPALLVDFVKTVTGEAG